MLARNLAVNELTSATGDPASEGVDAARAATPSPAAPGSAGAAPAGAWLPGLEASR